MRVLLYAICIVASGLSSFAVIADEPALAPAAVAAVDFSKDVFPILQRSCFECHGANKQEGGLRLDVRAELLNSGSVEAGEPDRSELLRRIALPRAHDELMPAIGDPLSRTEVATVAQWILQGALWPEDFQRQTHWAYVAPIRPALPAPENLNWIQSPIDAFVLHRLEQNGLTPSPPASTEKLVRRIFFDLIGLPPTPEEVNAYVDNESEHRLEELIDALMQRPEFGERWARPWLDLARYADSHGFQRDDLRDIWAYRDWVIQALNDDMPFDQFTVEQIAGDLLPGATESQRIATGFHRCAPTNVEAGSLPEETRVEQVLDRVNTTGAVWLGTTLECCQCHDHKYDPFTNEEYYRLFAFYNSTEQEATRADEKKPSSIQFKGPSMPLANPERDSKRAELLSRLEVLKKQREQLREELSSDLDAWSKTFLAAARNASQTHPLTVENFQSLGTTDTFEVLSDGSILLVGDDPPERDHYQFSVATDIKEIRGFRLDALQHESLPGMGPGRGDPVRKNFVLNEFSVQLVNRSASERADTARTSIEPLLFSSAKASFSQKGWDVASAAVGDARKGWAISPKFDQPHWALFLLKEPLTLTDDYELKFSLKQSYGSARTLGRFRVSALTGNIDHDSVPTDVISIAALPKNERTKQQRGRLLDYRASEDPASQKLDEEIAKIAAQIATLVPDTTLVMIELPEPRTSTVFERGDYRNPGAAVEPGTPRVLHRLTDNAVNRLALARWLVSPENPLVARVTVNRYWAELFGNGIVATAEDFGIKGESPTHPELLDWLAVEFMENGWSLKRFLKTILMSSVYQQSSVVSPELFERDPDNRLMARGARMRMDAETIRDNALSIAGLLSLEKSGPPIRPYQPDGIWSKVGGVAYNYEVSPGDGQYRRGVYVVLKRGSPYPSFMNFDASARLACTVQRSRTNTPLQALTLLNDPVYVAAAEALASRVQASLQGRTLEDQLDYAFQLCTARKPTNAERQTLQKLFAEQQGNASITEEIQTNSRRAWSSVATVLLNLHETICKD